LIVILFDTYNHALSFFDLFEPSHDAPLVTTISISDHLLKC
jgi:hypothetical protein